MPEKSFAAICKACRAERHWTTAELARRMGVSVQTVYRWEADGITPQKRWLIRFNEIFPNAVIVRQTPIPGVRIGEKKESPDVRASQAEYLLLERITAALEKQVKLLEFLVLQNRAQFSRGSSELFNRKLDSAGLGDLIKPVVEGE